MTEVALRPRVDEGYFKESHTQIVSHAKLLSEAIGEKTPALVHKQSGKRRAFLTRRGAGAHHAFATPSGDRVISVGFAGPVVKPGETVDAESKVSSGFGIRIGASQVIRKAKHIEEYLRGRAVHDAGIILFELARLEDGRQLSQNILRKADTVLHVASFSYTDDDQKRKVVTLPDAASGKVIQVITEESVPDPANPGAGLDDKTRRALIDKAKQAIASARDVMNGISDQAIVIQLATHHGQEMACVQAANATGPNGQWISLSDISGSETPIISGPENIGIYDLGQRDTIKIGADTVTRKFTYLRPRSKEQGSRIEVKQDELIALVPGWSGPYDGVSIMKLGQEYANQGKTRTLVANARVDTRIGEDDLFVRAQAIAELIIKSGVKKVTLTGHSQGGPQAADIAYILQERRKEQLRRGDIPTIPEVEGLVLHDPVGIYDQRPWTQLAIGFVKDMGATAIAARREQRREGRRVLDPGDDNHFLNSVDAGTDIVVGIGREMKESGVQFPMRTGSEIRWMAKVPADRKERMAALECRVILITGEHDPISKPEKFVPGYQEKSALEREAYLRETVFKKSPFIRLLTAGRLGHHGLPLLRDEDMPEEAFAQLADAAAGRTSIDVPRIRIDADVLAGVT